jgi:hypothetical protein
MSSAPAAPSPAEVKAIAAAGGEPALRNLRITEAYSRLAAALRERVGGGVNWCGFATWASRQAGSTIRGEDLGERLREHASGGWTPLEPVRSLWRALLRRGLFHPATSLGALVRDIHSPFDALERASAAVAEGNRKVFVEIGHEVARYLEECAGDASPEAPSLARFLEPLSPGPAPDGQDALRRAFRCFQRMRTETGPSRRAQLLLLANLEIGCHEQTRLQPEIARALEAGPDTAVSLKSRLPGPMAVLAAPYGRFSRELARRVISECLMVLRLPDRPLRLGEHLDAPTPPLLADLDEPALTSLVASLEPPGVCRDCGADDWADYRQRMHYILHVFRAFQENARLHEPPFSPPQLEAIRSGRIPDGPL